MKSDDQAQQAAEAVARAALERHRADLEAQWQAVASAYTEAMMAAQVMERAAAVVVVADAISETDQADSSAIQDEFERAFSKVTLGQFKNESPIANDAALGSMIDDAWRLRNMLAHRFFLENVLSLLDVTASEKLLAELADAHRKFESVTAPLMTLAERVAEGRGVDPAALLAFGKLAQVAVADSPQLFHTLNPWLKNEGEHFVEGVAEFFGIDINEKAAADVNSPAPRNAEEE